ncbi:MAG TPA: formate C-acetyltransferase/glycerol dehydratase family glycyl radical enzyme, partial [Thermoleophilia bacterium]|nr:formate C-acetyltransferase/glycerol dehydratase family glycyl radical enzyme [Thermoleophilia bacterium]
FKETEGEPVVIRRAKGLKRACETKTILIQDDELIVGNAGRRPRTGVLGPEMSAYWFGKEMDTLSTRAQDPYLVDDEQKELFRERIEPYWRGKTVIEHWLTRVPEKTRSLSYETGVIDCEIKTESGPGEIALGYGDILLPKGWGGVRGWAEERLAALDTTDPASDDKRYFLEAVVISCEAMGALARRHAEAARAAAASAAPDRAAELERVAAACDWVAEKPPRTFHEALQLLWFSQLSLMMELNAPSYSPNRMDQYLYPYYAADVRSGELTPGAAQELLECLWIKLAEQCWILNTNCSQYFAGYTAFQNVTVGGVKADGEDATNDVSYMLLQASMDVRLNQPSLAVRLHRNCPEEFLLKVCELSRLGTGFPAIHNDEVGIKALLRKGVTTEEARDWCLVGCVEPNLPGKLHQWSDYGHYNFGSAVEFALFNGEHLLSGRTLGLETGDPNGFATFEEFEAAVMAQLAEQIRHIAIQGHVTEALHRELLPCPLASSLMLDCIDNGADLLRGGARYKRGPGTLGIGLSDGVNSLAAVKKLVYDDKRLTMDELREAIRADFEGYEEIRDLCLGMPKYGNDDDEVDQYVRHFAHLVVAEHEKYPTLTGGTMMPSWYPVSSNVPQGLTVAALPSGRKAKRPLADGVSPNQGTDRLGPTAVLRSVGKFQHEDLDGGTLLNVKFEPQVVAGDDGLQRFAAYLRGFLDLPIYHVQFNVVEEETLRCAQEHPEDYRSLLVRVAGYSAFFVELHKDIQDDIISRTSNARL